jgi:Tol biopolymer transport system component/DNA-binding winged helix-turn-helix (wHTH) protein
MDRGSDVFRFDDVCVDVGNAQILKSGKPIGVEPKAFDVLVYLLEHRGRLVDKDELLKAVWRETFVTENALTREIALLRKVLGDRTAEAKYIETVPRRGYRFIAPVSASEKQPLPGPPIRFARKRSLRLVIPLLTLGIVAGIGMWLRAPLPPPKVTRFTPITSDGLWKANLVTDGTRIYFNEIIADHYVVSEVSAAGGETTILDSSAPGFDLCDVSPDGSKLLLVAAEEKDGKRFFPTLRVLDVLGGGTRAVGSFAFDFAKWAPDGRILFNRGSDVFLVNVDGSGRQKLLTVPGEPYSFRFSPDGRRLRFTLTADSSAGLSIWETNAGGTGLHELLPHSNSLRNACCGRWTPDGRYFVFAGADDDSPQIWSLEERHPFWRRGRKEPVQLTSGPMQFANPVAGGDGRKVFALGSQPRAELVRYDGKFQAFVPFLPGLSAGDVETSHDRKHLIYVKYPEGTLWRSNIDGSNRVQLTDLPLQVTAPHWSPDDKRIAFSGWIHYLPVNIFLIPSDGGAPEKITSGVHEDVDATWSPDGGSIAFGQIVKSANSFSSSIKLLDLNSRKLSELTASEGLCCPRWSPDGRLLVGLNGENTQLLLFSFSTNKWSVLADNVGGIGYMTWMADSKFVVFDNGSVKEPFFYRVRIADSRLEPIVSLKDVRRYRGRWGPWAGLAPDGSPLLVRDLSNQEIYALDLQLP